MDLWIHGPAQDVCCYASMQYMVLPQGPKAYGMYIIHSISITCNTSVPGTSHLEVTHEESTAAHLITGHLVTSAPTSRVPRHLVTADLMTRHLVHDKLLAMVVPRPRIHGSMVYSLSCQVCCYASMQYMVLPQGPKAYGMYTIHSISITCNTLCRRAQPFMGIYT